MIQNFIYDIDDNLVLELDGEGIDYLVQGLHDLLLGEAGKELSTPTISSNSAPWWRFWDRRDDPFMGEFILRRVA